uniref:Uncharacterized protein n=1 Tax=Alexandrium catenella TaxID=2925 RepID=A0A7S1QM80_ALECA
MGAGLGAALCVERGDGHVRDATKTDFPEDFLFAGERLPWEARCGFQGPDDEESGFREAEPRWKRSHSAPATSSSSAVPRVPATECRAVQTQTSARGVQTGCDDHRVGDDTVQGLGWRLEPSSLGTTGASPGRAGRGRSVGAGATPPAGPEELPMSSMSVQLGDRLTCSAPVMPSAPTKAPRRRWARSTGGGAGRSVPPLLLDAPAEGAAPSQDCDVAAPADAEGESSPDSPKPLSARSTVAASDSDITEASTVQQRLPRVDKKKKLTSLADWIPPAAEVALSPRSVTTEVLSEAWTQEEPELGAITEDIYFGESPWRSPLRVRELHFRQREVANLSGKPHHDTEDFVAELPSAPLSLEDLQQAPLQHSSPRILTARGWAAAAKV